MGSYSRPAHGNNRINSLASCMRSFEYDAHQMDQKSRKPIESSDQPYASISTRS